MGKRRRRLSKSRRRKRSVIRSLLLVFLLVVLFKGTAYLLSRWTYFTVTEVEVRGARVFDREKLEHLKGLNILKVDTDGLRDEITKEECVADASVSRMIPHKLRIDITERVPVAAVMGKGGLSCIDVNGKAFLNPKAKTLPLVRGWDGKSETVLEFLGMGTDLIKGYRIKMIDCGNAYELMVTYRDNMGNELICNFGEDGFEEKLSALRECVRTEGTAGYADLRFLPYVVLGNGGGV